MVKHTQTIRRLLPTNCLSVFDHFVGLVLEGLNVNILLLTLISSSAFNVAINVAIFVTMEQF